MAVLFVGGTRSGKSALAQRWAEAEGKKRLFLATCQVEDAQMAERVAKHQAERGVGWQSLELAGALLEGLQNCLTNPVADVLLIDCLSTWIAARMQECSDASIVQESEQMARLCALATIPVGLVSAETGLGLISLSPVGRRFCDLLGLVNQCFARACSTVLLVSCGLPLVLKGELPSCLK